MVGHVLKTCAATESDVTLKRKQSSVTRGRATQAAVSVRHMDGRIKLNQTEELCFFRTQDLLPGHVDQVWTEVRVWLAPGF